VTVKSLAGGGAVDGKITSVTMLGSPGELQYLQDAQGLKVSLPSAAPGQGAYTLKISGLTMNAPAPDPSGNPE
jgi:hypothetical protein